MASNGIKIGVASDTKAFLSGIKQNVLQPLETTDKALKELGTTGDRAGAELERTFREQQQDTSKLAEDIKGLNLQIKQGSQSSSRQMMNDSRERTHAAEEGFAEVKDAAKQNAISTAASFNGSFDSIAGGAQGLASEFLAGFGPVGVLLGTVVAGGIGLLTSAIDNQTAATQADKQAVADLTQQYIDAGSQGKRSFDDVKTALQAMAEDTDGSAIISLSKAMDAATTAGTSYRDVVRSIASADPEQISAALRRVQALKDQSESQIDLSRATSAATAKEREQHAAHLAQQRAVDTLTSALRKAKAQATAAARAQELAAEAGLSDFQQKADVIGQLTTAYDDAASNVDTYLNKESGLFDVGKYIRAMQQRSEELDHYQKHLAEANLTPEAKAFLDAQGADAAAAMLAGYRKASRGQQAELDQIWTTAGRKNVQSYGDAVGRALANYPTPHLPPPRIPAPSRQDLRDYLASAQAYLDQHPLQARATAYTRFGKPLYGDQ